VRLHCGARMLQAFGGQAAHFRAAAFYMTADQRDAALGLAIADRVENRDVFVVSFVDAVAIDEIKPPHHADAIRYALHRGAQFRVVGGGHKRLMEGFVERDHLASVADTLCMRHFPDCIEPIEHLLHAVRQRRIGGNQPAHREGFDQLAHLVQVFEALEIDRHDFPAATHIAAHQAVALQTLQRLTRGCARYAEAFGDAAFREPVARQQTHLEDIVAHAVVDVVSAR